MKKTGLCTEGNWYKGNLHLHSTNSDGVWTPEEVAKVYREHGYHFISFTEHEHYTYNQELDSEHFIIIPGTELSCEKPEPFRIYHMLGLGQDKAMDCGWAKNGFYHHQIIPVKEWEGMKTPQSVLDEINGAGNLAVLNHPDWSRMELSDFMDLDGFFALEIYNFGCDMESHTGTAVTYWDSLLRRGRKIWGIATDDAHFRIEDYCGGWVMVNAKELTILAVTEALRNGNFYSSNGPEIYGYEIEDGMVKVDCSPAREIHFITYETYGFSLVAQNGESYTHGEFKLSGEELYVRVEVIDHRGKTAWSNPIFIRNQ